VIDHYNTGTNLSIKPRKTNYFITLRITAYNSLSRSGSSSAALEVLHEIKGFDANGVLVNTGFGTLNLGAQQSNLTLSASCLFRATGSGIASETFSVFPDGNDYVTGSDTKVNLQ